MPNRIIRDAVLDSDRYDALPIEARLAFFEILLRADDYGLIPLQNLWLRRHCPVFDGRSSEFADGVLSALADQDLIRVYVHDGKRFAFIPQFGNRPQAIAPKYPIPPATLTGGAIEEAQRQAKNLPRTLKRQYARNQVDSKMEQGSNRVPTVLESPETETETETETKEQNTYANSADAESASAVAVLEKPATKIPPCPIDAVIEAYHEALPVLPRVAVRNSKREGLISARWRQVFADGKARTKDEGLTLFREFFAFCRESKFLTGQARPRDKDSAPFRADLEWLMSPTNFAKTVEGRYHR